MKTPLSLFLAAAVVGSFACSDEGGADRTTTGGSGGQVGAAGSGAGGSSGMTGGGGSAGSPGAGGGGSSVMHGPEFTIAPIDGTNVPINDANGASGVNGAAYLVQSKTAAMQITTPATLTGPGDKVCVAGNTVPVPMGATGDNYDEYWGAEIDFDLNRVASDTTAAQVLGDAGVDAGGDAGSQPLGQTAGPWSPPGNVIGFSFVVEGNDPALPNGGIPAAFRFKGRPDRSTTAENFCLNYIMPPVSGAVQDVLFTQVVRNCWETTRTAADSLFQDPAAYTQLLNLGWQIPASPMITLNFNFCVSKIAPILSQ